MPVTLVRNPPSLRTSAEPGLGPPNVPEWSEAISQPRDCFALFLRRGARNDGNGLEWGFLARVSQQETHSPRVTKQSPKPQQAPSLASPHASTQLSPPESVSCWRALARAACSVPRGEASRWPEARRRPALLAALALRSGGAKEVATFSSAVLVRAALRDPGQVSIHYAHRCSRDPGRPPGSPKCNRLQGTPTASLHRFERAACPRGTRTASPSRSAPTLCVGSRSKARRTLRPARPRQP